MDSVGQVKIYPAWNGGGPVKLRLLDSDNNMPSAERIEQVQTLVDSVEAAGQGLGIAPIGYQVTVEPAESVGITVNMTTYLEPEMIKNQLSQWIDSQALFIKALFKDLNWEG